MKYIIVTGDRYATWEKWKRSISHALDRHAGFDAFTVIHGGASGIDIIAASIARESGYCGATVPFRADWKRYGRSAGPRRNGQMIAYVQEQVREDDTAEVIAFHDDLAGSKGTKDMVSQSRRAGLTVTVYGSDGRVQS